MGKITVLLILLMISVSIINSSESPNKDLIKRKIAILPFNNENSVKEYDYLEGIIRDALRAKLQDKNLFLFANFSDVDEKIKGVDKKELVNSEDTIVKTVLKINADVAVVGKYVIINDKIMIIANAIDILNKQSIVSAAVNGGTGVDIFNLVDELAVRMSDKMSVNFPMLEKSVLEQLIEKQQKQYNISKEEIKKDPSKDDIRKKEKDNSKKNDPNYRKFAGMLAGGIVCIVLGFIFTIIGAAITAAGGITYSTGYYDAGGIVIAIGAPILSIALLILIAGIILAPTSSVFYKRYKAARSSYIINPVLNLNLGNNMITAGISIKI